MPTRFKSVSDYFRTIDRVTAAARAFVERVRDKNGRGFRGGEPRVVAAANAPAWDDLLQGPQVWLVATDGGRIHVAPAPAALVADVEPLAPQDGADELLTTAGASPGRRVLLNARFLREAIHPRANRVVLHVPYDEREFLVASSYIDNAQIALAIIAPMRAKTAPAVHPCVIARETAEAGDAAG